MICLFLIFVVVVAGSATASRAVFDKSQHFIVLQLHRLDSPVITALKGPLSEIILSCFARQFDNVWLAGTNNTLFHCQ